MRSPSNPKINTGSNKKIKEILDKLVPIDGSIPVVKDAITAPKRINKQKSTKGKMIWRMVCLLWSEEFGNLL